MADVSVVIVSWNAREYLRKCLKSLRKANARLDAQILVVDNASADGSPEMVKAEFPEVQLIETGKNLGFASGNNVGLRQATGRYVCLVNSDVEVEENCIERLIAFLDANPDIGIAGPRIVGSTGQVQSSCFRSPTFRNTLCQTFALYRLSKSPSLQGWEMKDWTFDSIRDVDVLSGCFWIVRREALEQVGLLDENFFMYGEDLDWCKRFRLDGWRAVFYPEAQALHYGGGSSAAAPVRFYIEMQKANRRYWRKHYGMPGALFFSCVIFTSQLVRLIPRLAQFVVQPSSRKAITPKIRRSAACLLWVLHLGPSKRMLT